MNDIPLTPRLPPADFLRTGHLIPKCPAPLSLSRGMRLGPLGLSPGAAAALLVER
jgi:hypothetical protein